MLKVMRPDEISFWTTMLHFVEIFLKLTFFLITDSHIHGSKNIQMVADIIPI